MDDICSTIVFVCHNQSSVNECLEKHKFAKIILVGPGKINNVDLSRIIIARDLPHNIEHEVKLLSFTAWYAIVKNNLFLDSKYICVLEYDMDNVPDKLYHNDNADILSFYKAEGKHFFPWTNPSVFQKFLNKKDTKYVHKLDEFWFASSNHSMRRQIVSDFVDWHYPDCINIIKAEDKERFCFYHERLLWYYIKDKGYKIHFQEGLTHRFSNSHKFHGKIKM